MPSEARQFFQKTGNWGTKIHCSTLKLYDLVELSFVECRVDVWVFMENSIITAEYMYAGEQGGCDG